MIRHLEAMFAKCANRAECQRGGRHGDDKINHDHHERPCDARLRCREDQVARVGNMVVENRPPSQRAIKWPVKKTGRQATAAAMITGMSKE
jgi:hypothetical protein